MYMDVFSEKILLSLLLCFLEYSCITLLTWVFYVQKSSFHTEVTSLSAHHGGCKPGFSSCWGSDDVYFSEEQSIGSWEG